MSTSVTTASASVIIRNNELVHDMNNEIKQLFDEAEVRWAQFRVRPDAPHEREWVAEYITQTIELDLGYRDLFMRFMEANDTAAMAELRPLAIVADQAHQDRLRHLFDQIGWPRISKYGSETCAQVWNIAVHSDNDIPFLTLVYELMEPLLTEGEVEAVHFAAIADRIALAEGRKQYWGMFYNFVDGKVVLCPTEDPEGLVFRRAEMGLGDTQYRRG
jgi:hypothetical protein